MAHLLQAQRFVKSASTSYVKLTGRSAFRWRALYFGRSCFKKVERLLARRADGTWRPLDGARFDRAEREQARNVDAIENQRAKIEAGRRPKMHAGTSRRASWERRCIVPVAYQT
jgi:hypothetical protein